MPAPATAAQKAAAAAVTDAAASSSGGGGWQAPYVNVFRLCGVEVAGAPVAEAPTATPAAKPGADQRHGAPEGGPAKLGYEKSGCVREKMDAKIGKRVLRITGTIPAGACVVGQRHGGGIPHKGAPVLQLRSPPLFERRRC
jgi:hypothetical protein